MPELCESMTVAVSHLEGTLSLDEDGLRLYPPE